MVTTVAGPQALEGVRVLDLSRGVAGSIAAMCLGDFGAEVLRIEDVDTVEPEHAAIWHRNKTVVRLDLSGDAGRREVERLIPGADVVFVDEAHSLQESDARAGVPEPYPHLISVRMPPGPRGVPWPLEGESPEFLAALAGVARRQSSHSGAPVESVFAHLVYEHGLWAAAVAVAALVERSSSGRGQVCEVDGMHAVLVASTATMVCDPDQEPQTTAIGPGGPNPVYSTYRCSDGEWIFLAALTPKFQDVALGVLGLSALLDDSRISGDRARLLSPGIREWVRRDVAAAFATRTRDEWLTELRELGCPAAALGASDTWLDDPQVLALGVPHEFVDAEVGRVVAPGPPVVLARTSARTPTGRRTVARAPVWPRRSLVMCAEEEGTPTGPLRGLRVLDLGTVLAGPYAGTLLADLGADVVKVEPPSGDPFRTTGFHYNRGQRSLAVDLRSAAGRDAFLRLAATADVVIDNYRPGVRERLHISHSELCVDTGSALVSVSISGYGNVGPMAGQPGFDPVLQAMSGMMSTQGGVGDPVFFSIPVNDVTAACAAAFGACVALYDRAARGEGQQVEVTLAAVSAFMQAGEIARYDSRRPIRHGGPDYPGPSPLDRFYPTADGYVRLRADNWDQLVAAGFLSKASQPAGDASATLADALREATTAQVVERLLAAGVSAVAARTMSELARDQVLFDGHYLEELPSADGRVLVVPGRYARFSRTQRTGSLLPPGTGEHSRELLGEAGLDGAAVSALLAEGSVVEGPPMTVFAPISYR